MLVLMSKIYFLFGTHMLTVPAKPKPTLIPTKPSHLTSSPDFSSTPNRNLDILFSVINQVYLSKPNISPAKELICPPKPWAPVTEPIKRRIEKVSL